MFMTCVHLLRFVITLQTAFKPELAIRKIVHKTRHTFAFYEAFSTFTHSTAIILSLGCQDLFFQKAIFFLTFAF